MDQELDILQHYKTISNKLKKLALTNYMLKMLYASSRLSFAN